jgi:predicted thioesterase/RimJ/RimL family protein N-acetyltransferase
MKIKNKLNTERLIFRPLSEDDFEAVQSWAGNPDNVRYMAWGPNSDEETEEFLKIVKPGKDFAIVERESNRVIGSCGIYPNEANYMADVGWILHMDYWKKGYGSEVAKELIRYGFEDLQLGRIQAPCAAINYGSYRIMENAGMTREALHRKAFWARVDKEWIDEAWYAILAEDYFAKKNDLIGKTATVFTLVSESNTAKAVGSGSLDVFATPMMIALMEQAACECIAEMLDDSQTSVGTFISVDHIAASPIGANISATATIENISGRMIEFSIIANSERNEIGTGKHTRCIVNIKKFMEKIQTSIK